MQVMKALVRRIDRTPLWLFALLVATVGLFPWTPEAWIEAKMRLLLAGDLHRPADILLLAVHATPWLLMAFRLYRAGVVKN